MPFDYNGIKLVEYNIDGGPYVDLGKIRSEGSDDATQTQATGTSAGIELYAGSNDEFTVMVTDDSKYAALETAMKDDDSQGTIGLRLTDLEDNTETFSGMGVIVQKNKSFSVGGRNAFMARFKGYSV